jgi:putative membrane protein
MGHHNQFMYADNFLAKVGGVNLGPRTFNYTSYIEGWALFME